MVDTDNMAVKLIIGIILVLSVLLPITLSAVSDVTIVGVVTNETFNTSTGLVEFQLAEDRIVVNSDVITNSTGTTFTRDTDYVFDYPSGRVNVSQTANLNQFVNVSYTFEPSGFTTGAGATILNILAVFVAIGALIFIAKTSGLMN